MNLDKLDKIILSEKEMWLLFEWKENHKEYVKAFKPVLKQGVIIIDYFHKQAFTDAGEHWIYNIYHDNRLTYTLAWNKKTKMGHILFSSLFGIDELEFNSSVITLHATLMAYMEYYSDKKEYVERKEIKSMIQRKSKSKSKNKKKSPIRIKKVVYNIKVNKESVTVDKKRYHRQMDKWTVRGHWREYKGGKKVWIKPYIKGEGEKITPKDYRL